ncbi:MAG: FAD-dependent oxidoreductase [Planctomycetota bacterium]|nr:FAD-dependent oxidoreductase [Planctomycetota bacterium]
MHQSAIFLLSCTLLCSFTSIRAALADVLPSEGLRLHLKADKGVEARDGRVVAWRDQSAAAHVAGMAVGGKGPKLDAKTGELVFSADSTLLIPNAILQADTREMTVLAVARADEEMSVSLLGMRDGVAPLIQLDVDEHANTRFIVRDKNGKTLSATTPAVLGSRTVFGGVLASTSAQDGKFTGTAQVFFGPKATAKATGPFSTPITGPKTWIGGLAVSGRTPFHWKGRISEIVVYDRALPQAQIEQIFQAWTKKYGLTVPKKKPVSDSPGPKIAEPAAGTTFDEIKTDVCVVGGGSGGFGSALAAARAGAKVVLVERQESLGGTSTRAFVNSWEPGPGCEFARELYDLLRKTPGAIGVTGKSKFSISGKLGHGAWDPSVPYEESLTRAIRQPKDFHAASFDADKMAHEMQKLLEETGRVKIMLGTTFVKAHSTADKTPDHSKRVESIDVVNRDGVNRDGKWSRIKAKVFIDATGGVHLCRKLGCEVMLGADAKSRFDEPSAPQNPKHQLNAISRCYQVRKSDNPKRQEKPESAPYFARVAHTTQAGEDVFTINPLPMLPGTALVDHGYNACMKKTEKAVAAHWNWLQNFSPFFQQYEFYKISPMLGIRESYRVVTKYVLRQQDLAAGWNRQKHDDLIAVADHPCDIHGAGGHLAHVTGPYGVPYRCLLPEGGWTNLIVACRGAGFSKIAASSCRLSRTMIQLGHAAGLAAAMAVEADKPVDEIDTEELTKQLDIRSRYPKGY